MASRAQSNVTTDHDQIRNWAEERGAEPACVRGTGGEGDIGMLRLEFPGAPGARDESLQPISWDDWFSKFDDRGLALLFQDQTARGEKSNFNKIIARETAEAREQGDTKASRRSGRRRSSGKHLAVAAAATRLRSGSRRKAAQSTSQKSSSRKVSSGTRTASSRKKTTKAASTKGAGRKSRTGTAAASSKRSTNRRTASTKSAGNVRSITSGRGSSRSGRTASGRGRTSSRSRRAA